MGSVRAIGVSNFNVEQLDELEKIASLPVSVVQNHFDLFNHDKAVRSWCKERGVR